MFGFSLLPFSTSVTKFLNGMEEGIILYVNRKDDITITRTTIISITLCIEQDKVLEQ
mgnify:CR=1 FL=1